MVKLMDKVLLLKTKICIKYCGKMAKPYNFYERIRIRIPHRFMQLRDQNDKKINSKP